ncbi:hypothetical protein ABG768_017979 [Culter alburnus]|uniref:Uncharacterized protein n=1 Tax=Culter alburnus TaxID=194366 RepID=A0AAW1YVQ3_CULAL
MQRRESRQAMRMTALRNCSSFENGGKGRKGGGWDSCINHLCGLCQTVAIGGCGEEMGFGNSENKSRLSVSTAQVQTPAAVAGGDALAGRVVERPPQRKTR